MTRLQNQPRIVEEYDTLLVDYAAGALPGALRLLVETHAQLNSCAGRDLAMAEAAAGVMLEAQSPTPMNAAPALTPPCPRSRGARPSSEPNRARGAIAAALEHADILSWRWRIPGYREHDLGVKDLRLVRLSSGSGLPPHGHGADEWTLVLSGAFEDSQGVYQRGELAFAAPGEWHKPRVVSAEDCVCLAATPAPLEFASAFGRAAAWVLDRTGA